MECLQKKEHNFSQITDSLDRFVSLHFFNLEPGIFARLIGFFAVIAFTHWMHVRVLNVVNITRHVVERVHGSRHLSGTSRTTNH